ncbi:MAG: hypothetical protein IH991_24100, partial [Planctomycetes bacterium]|nr:hypothetical protein [Planctomycetota bacterium]
MHSPRTLFFWVILAVFVTSTAAAREWKDKKGNKRTGEFVRFEAGNVVIEARGAEFSVPFEKLSAQDQEFVRNKLEELGQSDLLPGSNRPTVTNPMDPVTPDDPIRDDTAQSPTPNPA